MNTDTPELTELEVVHPSVIMSIERAQIDSQIATAHQFPRSLAKFQKRALEMATLDEETAESCIYVRPVGKKKNEETGKWEMQYAEGPSIRLAEIVAACYGNLRVASRIIEQTPRFVKCEGIGHDLESNTAMKCETIEPTVTKDGAPFSEGMRAVVAKAALSKACRDATFRVVPKALCKSIITAAKKVASGATRPLDERRAGAQLWVKGLKTKGGKSLDPKRVFEALGVAGWADVGEDQLIMLTGLRTAINDNETTVDDAFPPLEAAEKEIKGGKPADPFKEPPPKPAADPDNPESFM